jgi:hypothetical protein
MRVAYMTTNIRDVTQGWWECTTCGHKFAPVPKEPLTSKDPHCEHGYDVQEAICPVCKDGEFAHPPSNDQLPPDGKIDGDGVWRGGKWHPNEPLPSNPILDRLIHLQKFEWIKNHDTYNAGMSTREGRAALAEIERLRAALEWYANTSEAPKRALEALRDAPETTAQQAMREFEDGPGPISPESKKESP